MKDMLYGGMFWPYYIKKADVKDLIRARKLNLALITGSMSLVIVILHLVVFPKLVKLYADYSLTKPIIIEIEPYIVGALVLISIALIYYFYFTDYIDKQINGKIVKYKDDEMIKTSEILDRKQEVGVFIFLLLAVCFLIFSLIQPIYNLTNTISR